MVNKEQIKYHQSKSDQENCTNVDIVLGPVSCPVLVAGEEGAYLLVYFIPQLHQLLVCKVESQRRDTHVHQHLTLVSQFLHVDVVTRLAVAVAVSTVSITGVVSDQMSPEP